MKLIISPFITSTVAQQFDLNQTNFCATLQDFNTLTSVYYMQNPEEVLNKYTDVYLYPYLKYSETMWTKDINGGLIVAALLYKYKYKGNIHIIMDGEHHSEMFEMTRALGYEKVATNHNSIEILTFVNNIINDKTNCIDDPKTYKFSDLFWQTRIEEIKNSKNLLEYKFELKTWSIKLGEYN